MRILNAQNRVLMVRHRSPAASSRWTFDALRLGHRGGVIRPVASTTGARDSVMCSKSS
jgi:hypothetical protein